MFLHHQHSHARPPLVVPHQYLSDKHGSAALTYALPVSVSSTVLSLKQVLTLPRYQHSLAPWLRIPPPVTTTALSLGCALPAPCHHHSLAPSNTHYPLGNCLKSLHLESPYGNGQQGRSHSSEQTKQIRSATRRRQRLPICHEMPIQSTVHTSNSIHVSNVSDVHRAHPAVKSFQSCYPKSQAFFVANKKEAQRAPTRGCYSCLARV